MRASRCYLTKAASAGAGAGANSGLAASIISRMNTVLIIALALLALRPKLALASFLTGSRPAAWRPTSWSSSSSSAAATAAATRFAASKTEQLQHSLEQGKTEKLFDDFVEFLKEQQTTIVKEIESTIERNSGATFCRDTWGCFDKEQEGDEEEEAGKNSVTTKSGGITRVLQGGDCIEKGACSFTLIDDGILTKERAANIRARQFREGDTEALNIQAGDTYSAAALSMVLHSRSPLVPTFRSDVRVFLVTDQDTKESWAWFGGGADLTPYYLFQDDIRFFHGLYQKLCKDHGLQDDDEFSYEAMKEACDNYFYLPARQEHRGTGGIFFDDMIVADSTLAFCKGVTTTWMPSWLPIVEKRSETPYMQHQKEWQKLRRGRYLEFNLLYDRGVKFGLMIPNPRIEGVMVSAPPEVSYYYKHQVDPGSPEAQLVQVLKTPQSWV